MKLHEIITSPMRCLLNNLYLMFHALVMGVTVGLHMKNHDLLMGRLIYAG